MYEIRWHGRAGQGVITVSRLLAYAGLIEGKHVQAFPEFGPERIGAPITGFTRISDYPISVHSRIYNPNVVIVLDPTLLEIVKVTNGIKDKGVLLVNSSKSGTEVSQELGISTINCYTVDATKISLNVFGSGKAFNTAMLGALIKVVPVASKMSLTNAMKKRFPAELVDKNLEVMENAMKEVK